jgi:hypothetical protein
MPKNKEQDPKVEEAPKKELLRTFNKVAAMARAQQEIIGDQVTVPVKVGEPLFTITGEQLIESKPAVAAVLGVNEASELSVTYFGDPTDPQDEPSAIFDVTGTKTSKQYSIDVNPNLPGEDEGPFVQSRVGEMPNNDAGDVNYEKKEGGDAVDLGRLVAGKFLDNEVFNPELHTIGMPKKGDIPEDPISATQLQALDELLR